MVFVHVLQGSKKRYVGITQDLQRRLFEHKAAHSNFSRLRRPSRPDQFSFGA